MSCHRFPCAFTVATLAVVGIACSSGGLKGGRAGSGAGGAGGSGVAGEPGTGGSESGGSGGIQQGGAGGSVTLADGSEGISDSAATGGTGAGGRNASGGSDAADAAAQDAAGTSGQTSTGGAGGASAETGTGGATGTGGMRICPMRADAPTGTPPLPSPAQLAYQRTELTALIYYGLTTYDGTEAGSPNTPPSFFAPTKLDAISVGQWTSSLKEAGFGQALLVAKHFCGFCLWPSAFTEHSVKNSPWQDGQGDVVALFSSAARASGLRAGLALSPWDAKYTSGKPDYETYFRNQLGELLGYGFVHEIQFDGFNAPTAIDWKSVFQNIKQAQPDALIWAGPEIVETGAIPDLQWIGNEYGTASRTTSSLDTANCGRQSTWCPYECNTSSYRPNWYWHPSSNPLALSELQKIYFQTVGMNCTLALDVPPSRTGELDPKNLKLLEDFGTWYASLYRTNLLAGQTATADSTWVRPGFAASEAVDGDICTYWAAATGTTTGRLEVTLASAVSAQLISIREAIELGERVQKYHVELRQNGAWKTAPVDTSGKKLQGTVIGNRQLWQVDPTSTIEAVALVVDAAKAPPAIAELGLY